MDSVVTWLGRINLILLAFNMIPALPLDGGRVLRALLWQSTGDFTRATARPEPSASRSGAGWSHSARCSLFLAGSAGGLWLALIGLFVSAAARAETSMATTRSALAGLHVSDAMVREPDSCGRTSRSRTSCVAPSHAAVTPPTRCAPTTGAWDCSSSATSRACPRTAGSRHTVGSVTAWDAEALAPGDDLGDALVRLAAIPNGRALVLEQGALAGLLSMTDVSRLIELRRMLA